EGSLGSEQALAAASTITPMTAGRRRTLVKFMPGAIACVLRRTQRAPNDGSGPKAKPSAIEASASSELKRITSQPSAIERNHSRPAQVSSDVPPLPSLVTAPLPITNNQKGHSKA